MNLAKYSKLVDLEAKNELQKFLYIAFYLKATKGIAEFSISETVEVFERLHFSKPNVSRLKKNITTSRDFIRGSGKDLYKIHGKTLNKLEGEIPQVSEKSEEIVSSDQILPESLFVGTRGFIESLSRQINASYEHNLFDGCAVLMRRLLEILLILSYEEHGIESQIKNGDGSYKLLNGIAADAKANSILGLSRNTKENLEKFRLVGNFSAHKIYYTAKRGDISGISQEYRASIEELLYKSGLIK